MLEKEPHSEKELIKSEKEILWEKTEKEVEKISNIENGVKKIITALNISEIPTSQSCEGHISYQENETRITVPFVEISAPNQPEKRFVGQEKIIPKITKKYGVPAEDVRTMLLHSAPWEEFKNAKETQSYKKWRKENKKIAKKTETLLKNFYEDTAVSSHVRLAINEQDAGQFEISNVGGRQGWQPVGEKNLMPEQKTELNNQLAQYQEEMDNFAEFSKEKYFTK